MNSEKANFNIREFFSPRSTLNNYQQCDFDREEEAMSYDF